TITFLNVPIFTVVSPASANDKNYAFVLLEKVVKYLDLSGFNFLACFFRRFKTFSILPNERLFNNCASYISIFPRKFFNSNYFSIF
ncbi:hypothetical protein, partial [Petrotoga sp. DB-2]